MDENERPRKRYKTYMGDPGKKLPKSTSWYRRFNDKVTSTQTDFIESEATGDKDYCRFINNTTCQLDTVDSVDELLQLNDGSESPTLHETHNFSLSDNDNVESVHEHCANRHEHISSDDENDEFEMDDENYLSEQENDEECLYNENLFESDDDVIDNDDFSLNAKDNIEQERRLLTENCSLTRKESELLIIATALRHHIPDVGLDNLIQLVDSHLSNIVYKSKYKFLQPLPDYELEEYYYCCKRILSFSENNVAICTRCESRLLKSTLKNENKFFIYIPLEQQLRELINSSVYESLRKECDESDVLNGEVYRNFRTKNVIQDNDISLQWNVDGVSLCKSSKKSMWAIQVAINELPYRIRKKNVILCGLWYADKKPPMNLYLKPFIEELLHLQKEGLTCTTCLSDEEINLKVHTLFGTVDSVARPLVQNMKQFNGEYGCPYCIHKGEQVDVGRGTTRVYPWGSGLKTCRTHDKHMTYVEHALRLRETYKGVKGPSVVSLLPYGNIINDYPPDYMHSCLLGVGKLFATAWFDSKNNQEKYYMGLKADEFNSRLLNIKPSNEITRTPSSVYDKYNANDWKNFILYYSTPCLDGLLHKKYFKHWHLFVYALYTFSKPKISDNDFELGKKALLKFVKEVEPLYGKKFMKFNVHLLTHIPHFVQRYGALWAWSAFPYENFNGVIKRLFYGTQYIAEQICKAYNRLRYVKSSTHIFSDPNCSSKANKLFIKLMNECRVKKCIEYGDSLRIFGKARYSKLSLVQKMTIEQELGETIEDVCKCYVRFICNNILFQSVNYKRLKKRHNSTAITTDNQLITISNLLEVTCIDSGEIQYVVMGKKMLILDDVLCQNENFSTQAYSFIAQDTSIIMCREIGFLKNKCIKIPWKSDKFCIVPIVNRFETD